MNDGFLDHGDFVVHFVGGSGWPRLAISVPLRQDVLIAAPSSALRDGERVCALLSTPGLSARERIVFGGCIAVRAEQVAESNLVGALSNERLDDGQVGNDDRDECLATRPSTSRDCTVFAGLEKKKKC